MAVYKTEHGFQIKSRSSDPSNLYEGEIWYNTTTQTLKVSPLIEAFASGGNLPQGIARGHTAGTQTAALMHHGTLGGGDQPNDNKTFEYDGSSWTAGGNVSNMMRVMGGSGTQTDAMGFGGAYNPIHPAFHPTNSPHVGTESYNGTSWTAEANYPRANNGGQGCGAGQTATLSFGGNDNTATTGTETYEYNGTAWSEEGDMNLAAYGVGGAGTSTAALKTGRYDPVGPATNQAEEYDGSSWTNVNASTLSRSNNFATGGPQTAAYSVGGRVPGLSAVMESYDGTNWTTRASMATAREAGGGALTAPSETAFCCGGMDASNYLTGCARSVDTS
jgi:hypothetical protein